MAKIKKLVCTNHTYRVTPILGGLIKILREMFHKYLLNGRKKYNLAGSVKPRKMGEMQ